MREREEMQPEAMLSRTMAARAKERPGNRWRMREFRTNKPLVVEFAKKQDIDKVSTLVSMLALLARCCEHRQGVYLGVYVSIYPLYR